METERIVTGCILSAISALLFLYVSFTARKKGPIFSNTYIWASKEEQQNADKNAEYRLVTVVFALLGGAILCDALYVFTECTVFFILFILFVVADIVFAVVDTVKQANLVDGENK